MSNKSPQKRSSYFMTTSLYSKYNHFLCTSLYYLNNNSCLYFTIKIITGIFFFTFPILISCIIYLTGTIEDMLTPITSILRFLLLFFIFLIIFKFYFLIKSNQTFPTWERNNIGLLLHVCIILGFCYNFFKKCSFCLNESVFINKEESNHSNTGIKNGYYVSSFVKYVFILIINGNNNIENNDKEVFDFNNENNKDVTNVLMSVYAKVIWPIVLLQIYLLIKTILITEKQIYMKIIMNCCILFEYYTIFHKLLIENVIGKICFMYLSKYNCLIYYACFIIDKIYFMAKKRKGNEIEIMFFGLMELSSILIMVLSYLYIIVFETEDYKIKGKNLFFIGLFLFVVGYSYICGKFFVMKLIFLPIKKGYFPKRLKLYEIRTKTYKGFIPIKERSNYNVPKYEDDKDFNDEEHASLLNNDNIEDYD